VTAAYATAHYRYGERLLSLRRLALGAIANLIAQESTPSVFLVSSSAFHVIERADELMYGFRGDGYSGYSTFVLDLHRPAEGHLDTSWSPVRPIYVFRLKHEAKYVLSDDLSTLSSLVEMLTGGRRVDELFGVWSLTGRPAGQFGTSLIRTPWSDINQLPAGVRASFGDQMSFTRRESPFWTTDQLPAHRAAAKIRFAFETSVASCIDGTAAILVSGGIDSSAIVGVCRALNRDVVLMTNFYPDAPETDEMPYTRLLEHKFGYPLIPLRGRRESLLATTLPLQARPFRGLFRSDDEEVIRCAKQRDIQVVVDGLGGDELFAVRDFPLGRLSNRRAARQLLGHRDWSAIYGRRDYDPNPPELLPPSSKVSMSCSYSGSFNSGPLSRWIALGACSSASMG
jgi:hypothetical protein